MCTRINKRKRVGDVVVVDLRKDSSLASVRNLNPTRIIWSFGDASFSSLKYAITRMSMRACILIASFYSLHKMYYNSIQYYNFQSFLGIVCSSFFVL